MIQASILIAAYLAAVSTAAPTTFLSSLLKREQNQVVTGSVAVDTINDSDGVGAGVDAYNFYQGDGSTGAGWPDQSKWVSFNEMFEANKRAMQVSCVNNAWSNDNNSDQEIQDIRDAIEQVAQATKVDHRFILATIMQESKGCVRVKTTVSPDGTVINPGLMQDHHGANTCHPDGQDPIVPCPKDTIVGMIQDGSGGTAEGDGLAGTINQGQAGGAQGAQAFYIGARIYNSGSNPTGDLGAPGATRCYASDMANRLTGWTDFGPASTCAF